MSLGYVIRLCLYVPWNNDLYCPPIVLLIVREWSYVVSSSEAIFTARTICLINWTYSVHSYKLHGGGLFDVCIEVLDTYKWQKPQPPD